MKKTPEAIGKRCSNIACAKRDICMLLEETPAKILEIQEKAPRKRSKPIPTIELAIQVVADMERGTSFCTAYRRLNLPEAKLRAVINSDEELLARYKKAILITKLERRKKYWKG